MTVLTAMNTMANRLVRVTAWVPAMLKHKLAAGFRPQA